MDHRKYLGIGPRTRKNILKGKNIRKLEDGADVFEDYWTDGDSDSEQSSTIESNSNLIDEPETFVIPNSQQEFSKVTVTKRGKDKITINKSSLLLKEVTEIPPCLARKSMATKTKNAAQMEEILTHYDEVDLQIMQIMGFNGTNEVSQNHKKGLNDSACNSNSRPVSKCTSKNGKELIDESTNENGEYDLELLAKKLGKVASSNKISPSKQKVKILYTHADADDFYVQEEKRNGDNEKNPLNSHTSDADDNFSVQKEKGDDDNIINPLNVKDALENLHTSFTKNKSSPKKKKYNEYSKNRKIGKNKKRVVNEENEKEENTSENMCTSATKDDLSLRKVQVRKSSRQRYTPLAHWRNERLLYRYEKDNINLLGIDKGTNEDDASVKFLFKKYQRKEFSRKEFPKPKKAKLMNPEQNKILSADILKRFSLIPWNLTEEQNEKLQPYLIKRMFETPETAFGFIQINVEKEKPRQYMPEDDVQLTVIRGEIELTLQKNSYNAKEKDMFVVPRGCAYSIKNTGKKGALLSFVVGKFNFFESQID